VESELRRGGGGGGFLARLFRHNLQAFRLAGDPLPYLGRRVGGTCDDDAMAAS